MRRLAIDTSSTACTVALRNGEQLIERHEEQPRAHTRLLMPMIRDVLQEAQVSSSDLDSIVLGNGPGSFIGMRIAASVAQGLAHGAGIKIRPASSLAAVAAEALTCSDCDIVAVAQDAHMNEVYLGLFERGSDNTPVAIAAERLFAGGPIDELQVAADRSAIAVGSGWNRYPDMQMTNTRLLRDELDIRYPRARYLLAISAGIEAVDPALIDPAYIRQKVAEKPRQSAP